MGKTHSEAHPSSSTVAGRADSPQMSRIESLPVELIRHIIDTMLCRNDTEVANDLASLLRSSPMLFAPFCAYLNTMALRQPLSRIFFVKYQVNFSFPTSRDATRADWWEFWAQHQRVSDMIHRPSGQSRLLDVLVLKLSALGYPDLINASEPRRLMRSLLIYEYICASTRNSPEGPGGGPDCGYAEIVSNRLTPAEVADHQALWNSVASFYLDQIDQYKILQKFEIPRMSVARCPEFLRRMGQPPTEGFPTRAEVADSLMADHTCTRLVRILMARGLSFLEGYLCAAPAVRIGILIEAFDGRDYGAVTAKLLCFGRRYELAAMSPELREAKQQVSNQFLHASMTWVRSRSWQWDRGARRWTVLVFRTGKNWASKVKDKCLARVQERQKKVD